VQFYSGGYLSPETVLERGVTAHPGCALAFEPQELPVFRRHPPVLTHPGVNWKRWIKYTLDTVSE
jgi:hypothetical protein